MKKVFHICKSSHGCFGASGSVSREPGMYSSKSAADKARAKLQRAEKNYGTVYFVEWDWR